MPARTMLDCSSPAGGGAWPCLMVTGGLSASYLWLTSGLRTAAEGPLLSCALLSGAHTAHAPHPAVLTATPAQSDGFGFCVLFL